MSIKTKITRQCRLEGKYGREDKWRDCINPDCTNQKRTIIETIVTGELAEFINNDK